MILGRVHLLFILTTLLSVSAECFNCTSHSSAPSKMLQMNRRLLGVFTPAVLIPLGAAAQYVLLAESAITTGVSTVIIGNVGIAPGTVAAITIPGGLTGPVGTGYYTTSQVVGDVWGPSTASTTPAAKIDMMTAYAAGMIQSPSSGVADDHSAVLDGQVFTKGVTLGTGANSVIKLTGGVRADTVFWVLGTALTAGASSTFAGTVLAGSAATIGAGATLIGKFSIPHRATEIHFTHLDLYLPSGAVYAQTAITIGANVAISTCTDPHAATCVLAISTSCVPGYAVSKGYCVVATIAPSLGTACRFVLFGTSAITTGATCLITGNVGINPTTIAAVTIPGGLVGPLLPSNYYISPQVVGKIYGPGTITTAAQTDMLAAYAFGNNQNPSGAIDGYPALLDGQVFTKGVYRWTAAVGMSASATVTLNGALGDIFIFQMVTLGTGASSTIALTGGVQAATVFWVLGTTLTASVQTPHSFENRFRLLVYYVPSGATSNFAGIVLAGTAITIGAGVNFNGAMYAQSAVT
ncbi:hypothetical protein P7C70_g8667, partial [Phenoliferia sp. Uapishka_3]